MYHSILFKTQWLIYVPPALTLKTLHFANTLCFCILYRSQNNQGINYVSCAAGIIFLSII